MADSELRMVRSDSLNTAVDGAGSILEAHSLRPFAGEHQWKAAVVTKRAALERAAKDWLVRH